MPHALTESEVIAYARSQGVRVTRDRLKRWRGADVFPSVERRGLGRGRGTATFYPPGAERWAVDLGRALEGKRSLPEAAWTLWLKGYPLTAQARGHIRDIATRFEGALYRWDRGDLDLESATAKRTRRHPMIRAGLRSMTGGTPEPEDLSFMWASLMGAPAPATAEGLADVAKTFNPARMGMPIVAWSDALSRASDATLNRVRDEVLLLRVLLDAWNGGKESAVKPVHLLCWFGLTRASTDGRRLFRALTVAIARGHVPQLVEALRPAIPMLARAVGLYQTVTRDL
jgi:hypothetical protein